MSFGKLWVRMKGELLTLKEDFASEGDVGDKAEAFLTKLERLFATPSDPTPAAGRLEERVRDITERIDRQVPSETLQVPSLQELSDAYEELRSIKAAGKTVTSSEDEPLGPNPRRLG
jgi:hypothetical protein